MRAARNMPSIAGRSIRARTPPCRRSRTGTSRTAKIEGLTAFSVLVMAGLDPAIQQPNPKVPRSRTYLGAKLVAHVASIDVVLHDKKEPLAVTSTLPKATDRPFLIG